VTAQIQVPAIAAGTWSVSDSRTRVTFSVGNFGRRAHGSVALGWGELRVDAAGAPVRVRAELDLNGLDTGIARRDADLRKPRFLDVDRHPTMSWEADRFTRTDDGRWAAHGELHVRGTSVPLTVVGAPEAADHDGQFVRVRGCATLDRTAVGIRAPSFLIGRTVEIEIDAWLTPSGL
jgi:polyisoprenoid-binding protein YceI